MLLKQLQVLLVVKHIVMLLCRLQTGVLAVSVAIVKQIAHSHNVPCSQLTILCWLSHWFCLLEAGNEGGKWQPQDAAVLYLGADCQEPESTIVIMRVLQQPQL